MKRVALVWTEFQESVLLSVMKASAIDGFDIVFTLDKISDLTRLREVSDDMVILKGIPLSYRNQFRIRSEVNAKINKNIPKCQFDLWLCNYTFPYSRRLMFDKLCRNITLFEEGFWCYVNRGILNSTYGKRDFISTLLLKICYPDYGGSTYSIPKAKGKEKWGLFPGCFPNFNLPERLIDHLLFERTLDNITCINRKNYYVPPNSAIYLPSSISLLGYIYRLNHDIDYEVDRESLVAFINEYRSTKVIIWKPHPHSIMSDEMARSRKLTHSIGIEIRVVEDRSNFEEFVLSLNINSFLPVFSHSSNALLVAKLFSHRGLDAIIVKSKNYLENYSTTQQVYDLFQRLGIKII